MIMKKIGFAGLVLSTLVLAGCSGAPSDSDIEQAMRAEHAKMVSVMAGVVGEAQAKKQSGEIHSVTKNNCAEEGNVYICEISIDVEAPFVGRKTQDARVKMMKGDNGWIMTKAG